MENQKINFKSTITRIKSPFLLAACLVLATLAPPAVELSRAASASAGPPTSISSTQIISGQCAFNVQLSQNGKIGQINLPGNRVIFTSPDLYATLTNLSDPTKSVTLNITGAAHQSIDQSGNITVVLTGRNLIATGPDDGIVLTIGTFSFVLDSSGNLIQPLTGTGQFIHVCELIN